MDYIQLTPENLEKEYLCCADCPYTAKYVPPIERSAKDAGIPFKSILLENREQAQNAPAAWTYYALFYNGNYATNEILPEKKIQVEQMRTVLSGAQERRFRVTVE